ncbi:GNAT family N-acetyltransferase [Cellvibrio fibrivorans]|uniref:RimJ/RimL family protein N-acetyltransferase n=1 Tax=Cellvibrio fibrivorans TaxID=126350 RepID=A0ABU1UZ00_9GAMM|nr:GNAT family protein [Cellvibrio fibrivorans]MDR7090424.1 RimJ/RimL family protein N-acetyltransferase [Cellvibrio fibrivorans]
MNNPWLYETTLKGNLVTLAPLKREHTDALLAAASDGELWNLWFTSVPSSNSIGAYLDQAFKDQSDGRALLFVVIDNATQKIIGSTRYCNADTLNKRVEIGYTWYAKSFQRTGINTECKYLLLTHALETLDAIAVEFRTHWHNHASRAAIARLGAKQDGILRNHQKNAEGVYRDTVVFSIIDQEWPCVKKNLEYHMSRPA